MDPQFAGDPATVPPGPFTGPQQEFIPLPPGSAPAAAPGGISVVSTWTASRVITAGAGQGFSGSAVPVPPSMPLACTVASTEGNWLIAFCSWTLPAGYLGATVAVTDSTHINVWHPLGIPSGTSDAAGFTRCSIWACPAALATSTVFVSPCGMPGPVYPAVLGVTVIEVAGMSAYLGTPVAVTGSANSAGSVTANAAAPGAQALLLAVGATDGGGITGPGTGWASVTGVTAQVVDGSYMLKTAPAWQVTSSAAAASWAGATADFSACTATVLVSNPAPAQPNPNWPATSLQAGFGSGALTPPDQITWADITPRFLAGAETAVPSGKQYELDQLEAPEITMMLDTNDGALTPGNTGSPYWPDVIADVPLRLQMTWQGRTYGQFSAFAERWPVSWKDGTWYGVDDTVATDAWSLQTSPLDSVLREEMSLAAPYAYWPCGDVAGSAFAQNFAPGNTNGLRVITSKYGAGSAASAFGADSGALPGDPSATVWSQSGAVTGQGYCLQCADQNYPLLTGHGITVAGWFQIVSSPGGSPTLISGAKDAAVKVGSSPTFTLYLFGGGGPATPFLGLAGTDGSTALLSGTGDWSTAGWFHVALTIVATGSSVTAEVYFNGTPLFGGTAAVPMPSSIDWLAFLGEQGRSFGGNFTNGACAHLAIYPVILPPDRIQALYLAGTPNPQTVAGGTTQTVTGAQFAGEYPAQRIERLLAYGGWTGPRSISQTSTTPMAGITDIGGSPQLFQILGNSAAQGTQAAQAVNGVVLSDGGFMFVDGTGALAYLSRSDFYDQAPAWILGEDTASGEIPYLPAAKIGYDKSLLYNSAQLTQAAGSGVPVVADNTASIAQHGTFVFSATVYQQDVSQVADEASWIALTRGEVSQRAESVTADAMANPSLWKFLLSITPAVPVLVRRRPQGGGNEIAFDALLAQVRKTFDFSGGVARVALVSDAFPAADVLTAGDPVRGQLTGAFILGW